MYASYQVRVAIRKMIGTLGQMAIAHLNKSNTHKVNNVNVNALLFLCQKKKVKLLHARG